MRMRKGVSDIPGKNEGTGLVQHREENAMGVWQLKHGLSIEVQKEKPLVIQ